MDPAAVHDAVTRLARADGGRVLAHLARQFGDLDQADEAVQDALVQALQSWPVQGVPDNAAGWLLVVARRKAFDRLRRSASARRRLGAAAADLLEAAEAAERRGFVREDPEQMEIPDERLRLILLCCHPALHQQAQVALTLRLVGGLTTAEIAAAQLSSEPTVTQRIVRAKRKIRDAGIPLSIPKALDERVAAVLAVLYLIFNEGYLSHGADTTLRVDLADEALRLARITATLVPDNPEVTGLLALMLFQRSRFASRTDASGRLVLLQDQDRTRWDGALVQQGNHALATAMAALRPGVYQVQAVIAALHANAGTAADTDWPMIAGAYQQLLAMTGSPVVQLNHAVAVSMCDGPRVGLALLEDVEGLEQYHLLHATRGELLARDGRTAAARDSFVAARALAPSDAERRHLDGRIAATTRTDDGGRR
jgi:RNA polymerase sigma-70 factor (ECF subfamily)